MLPTSWSTERLLLRNVAAADSARSAGNFNANAHIGSWDPTFQPVPAEEMDAVIAAALGTGRTMRGDAFQMQAICWGEDSPRAGEIIGYYHWLCVPWRLDLDWDDGGRPSAAKSTLWERSVGWSRQAVAQLGRLPPSGSSLA